jgi:hypothetical protein
MCSRKSFQWQALVSQTCATTGSREAALRWRQQLWICRMMETREWKARKEESWQTLALISSLPERTDCSDIKDHGS